MPIQELQEPIWERQDGETPNQYCYFLEFLEFPTFNLKQFHDYLCDKNKKEQKGTKVVTYGTLRKWARESCNKWQIRKEAKRAAEKEDLLETLHELDKEDKVENFKRKNSFKKKLLDRLEREAEHEKYSQLKHGVDAYVNISDDNRIDMEEPTTFANQKLDVDADTRVEYQGVDNLLEAFHASKKEWDNHKNG